MVAVLLGALPGAAQADCTASAGGTWSFARRLSPRAGRGCIQIVSVHEGGSCAGEARWTIENGCNVTRRLAITDQGELVSILAPRTTHRDWSVVRVIGRAAGQSFDARLAAEEIPGLEAIRGALRLSFDADALVVVGRRTRARVPLRDLVRAARDRGAR